MITKQDIAEVRRVISDKNYFDILKSMAGAYVDGEKDIVHSFREPFYSVDEDKKYKYLKIAQEIPCVKGFDDKNMELQFAPASSVPDLLQTIVQSDLKDDIAVHDLYQRLIDEYEIENGFLILLFHGIYDVMTKTSDRNEIDESEEVYDFLLCAICPVNWDKPGLKYDPSGRICAKQLQNVVGKAETGFIWPAFEERSANMDKCLFYSQKPKTPQHEVIVGALDCTDRMTATENRMKFEKMVKHVIFNANLGGSDEDKLMQKLNLAFGEIVQTDQSVFPENESILTDLVLHDICDKSEISEVLRDQLVIEFRKFYGKVIEVWPKIWWLYDCKMSDLAKYNLRRYHLRRLMKEAAKVCESVGQQDLAQEIEETLEEMQDG